MESRTQTRSLTKAGSAPQRHDTFLISPSELHADEFSIRDFSVSNWLYCRGAQLLVVLFMSVYLSVAAEKEQRADFCRQ
jgi:hypothetical protein